MTKVKETGKRIAGYVSKVIEDISDKDVENFIDMVMHARKVHVMGAGRTGLVTKSFAMRLMHLDFDVYAVGETITPSIEPGDLLIAMSGSGKTQSTLIVAETAKKLGVKVVAITSFKDSPLAKVADCTVQVGGRKLIGDSDDQYIAKQLSGEHAPLTPMGTLFELSLNVFLDSVISELMVVLKKEERELKKRHSNLE